MSNKDYYSGGQQQQYYPPQGAPQGYPQQGGYYPQQPPQSYQGGYQGQPGYQPQPPPQTVYVQQPAPQESSGPGCCMACLTGMCLCCCAEEICECLF